MPRTQPKPEAVAANGWTPDSKPRFVRCDLSPQAKTALTMWAEEAEDIDLLSWMEKRVEQGHVLSIRSNEVGYQASLTGHREASGHQGISLVARASTPKRALYGCWYRDEVVLSGKWPVQNTVDELDF